MSLGSFKPMLKRDIDQDRRFLDLVHVQTNRSFVETIYRLSSNLNTRQLVTSCQDSVRLFLFLSLSSFVYLCLSFGSKQT